MIKNLIKKKALHAFTCLLLSNLLFAQPVIKVPATCNVVVAGTGSGVATGPGGSVGNGGFVCMPDPFDITSSAGNFTEVTGITINSWQLLGDISVQTSNVPPAAAVQNAGAVSLLNIESYNKNLRPSESTAPSTSTLARSKGKVRIYYKGSCENFIEFEILKSYKGGSSGIEYVPPILGSNCILPNTTYTFSVDAISSDNYTDNIGGDNYYWTLPFGIPLSNATYASSDKSSITFTTPSSLSGSNVISCCYGRCNPWDANVSTPSTCVTKTLTINPGATALSIPQCINTGQGNIAVSSSTPVKWQSTFPWTYSFPYPGSTSTNTLNFNGDNNSGTLIITTPAGNCPERFDVYQINRIYKSSSVTLSHSPSGACLSATWIYTFTVGPNALNNATTWRFPAGLVGAGIVTQNTTSATTTVTFLANAPAGQYKVWALSTACPSDSIVDSICIKPAVPVINSASCFTRGATGVTTITCTAVPGVPANGYTWNLPAGWVCTAGCNTTNPTFSLTGTAVLPYGVLTVTAATTGSCACATTSINDTVWYNPITPNSITASCWNTNGAATGTTVIAITNAPNPFFGSYIINSVTPSVPYTGYSVNAQGGIVLAGVNAVPGTVYTFTITHTTPRCGSSPATLLNITAAEIPGVVQILPGPGIGNTDTYYVSPSPAMPSYQWFVNGSAASATATQPLLGNGPAPTSVCVNLLSSPVLLGTTSVCRKSQICCTGPGCILGTHSLRIANGGAATGIKGVSVYPNPNDGQFTVTIPSFNSSANAILIDMQGKEVGNYTLTKGENAIVTDGLAKGLYSILFLIDDKSDSRKIEIK